MTIKLYLGAHKTATTHIQALLETNRELLQQNNIKLSTPTTLRPLWIGNFFKYCHKKEEAHIKKLQEEAPNSGIWILTDENLMGNSYELSIQEGMYPNIGKRLKCLKKLFPHATIELFFAMRSYETFYRSTYLEVVRNRGYIPFEQYYNETNFKAKSWTNVIKMFTEEIPEKNITLWLYEDIKTLMPQIINGLTELNNASELIANYKVEKTRPSLSNKTLEILASLNLSQEESKRHIETLNKQYPLSEEFPAFKAFSSQHAKQFNQQYSEEILSIQKKFPQINFLDIKI